MTDIDWEAARARLAASGLAAAPDAEEARAVLARRARRLADRRRLHVDPRTVASVLTFTIGAERYGLPLTDLREVSRTVRCTPVPGSQPDLLGVVNIHGEIVPVLDAAVLLGIRRHAREGIGQLLVLRVDAMRAALLVDGLTEIRRIDLGALNSPTDGVDAAAASFIKGVTGDLLAVLDVAALLAGSSIRPVGKLPADINRGRDARL